MTITWVTRIGKSLSEWVRSSSFTWPRATADRKLTANALFKRWKLAETQAKESEKYFDELCKSVGADKTKLWTELEEQIQSQREDDIKVMDQLDVKERKGSENDLCVYRQR